MRRSIAALMSAVLFALIAAGPTAAASPSAPGGGAMSASACIDLSLIPHVTVLWDSEAVNPTKDLTVFTTFSGGVGPPFTAKNTVPAPVPTTGSDSFGFVLSLGSSWSDWPNIANSANGAFKDKAPTLVEPADGWPAC